MTEEKLEEMYKITIKLDQVILGNGAPGLADQFATFMKDWVYWQTEGRFKNCPYLTSKTSKRWGIGLAIGFGTTLLTLGFNIAWKVLGI